MELFILSSKLILGFFLLFILIKIIGKKFMDKITPFHFISAIVLSELIGNAIYDKNVPIYHIPFTLFIWGGLLFLVEYVVFNSRFLRQILEGKPSMVIRNGQLDFNQLKKSRLTLNQLQSLLRQSETFSIREVAFAFIESNGSISILKKSPYQKTTLQDFNLTSSPAYLPITLIRDGKLIHENLSEINKDQQWLTNELLANGIDKIDDVVFAEWLESDGLFVVPRISHQTFKRN